MQELTPEAVLEQQTPAQEAEAQAAEETRLPEDLPDEGGVDDGLLRQESLRTLGEALGKLDDRSRALIVLRYYKRMSLKDTAARLGVSYAYVKVLHKGALRLLRKHMGEPVI